MTRRAMTCSAFAAELQRAGMRITWIDECTFRADNRRQMGNRRMVEVSFYRDVDRFWYGRHSGYAHCRLESMAAVRRYLKVSPQTFGG